MRDGAKREPDIARERARIGSGRAGRDEAQFIGGIGARERKLLYLDRARRRRCEVFEISFAREFVHPNPIALDGREYRRDLLDLAAELARDFAQTRVIDRWYRQFADDVAFTIERIGLDAQFDNPFVNLLAAFEHRRELGRLPNHDRQHTRRKRIQRAEMPDARRLDSRLDAPHDLGRGYAARLIDDDDSVQS